MKRATQRVGQSAGVKLRAVAAIAGLLLGSLVSQEAGAVTRVVFHPDNSKAFIIVQGVVPGHDIDSDAQVLFEAISLPASPVPGGGNGKQIRTSDEIFQLSCVSRDNQIKSYMCNFVVRASARSVVSSSSQTIEFSAQDAEARDIYSKLIPGDDGVFRFESTEGGLKLEARPERFHLIYKRP